jgi:Transport protein Trs120 or TRAPPC9, TRAPP II complex subunit
VIDERAIHIYETHVYRKTINACWVESEVTAPLECYNGLLSNYSSVGPKEPLQVYESLLPNEQKKFTMGVFGKRYCTGVTLQIQYGSVDEAATSFFTRDLLVPVLITVGCPLSLLNTDFLQFTSHGEVIKSLEDELKVDATTENSSDFPEPRLSNAVGPNISSDYATEYFLFTFDVVNEWIEPFKVTFEVYDGLNVSR